VIQILELFFPTFSTLIYAEQTQVYENKLASLVNGQTITIIPEFTLSSGVKIRQVPVAYKTWGELNEQKDNVMVICHALSGSADVEDW